jgi:glycosyltransferase involved in cell wall biosynthesis
VTATIVYVQPTSEVGGSDVALARLVKHLDRSRYRPVVVLPRQGPVVPLLTAAGAEVRILPMRQLRSLPSVSYQARFVAGFASTVARLRKVLMEENAQLVHSNSLFSLYGAWAAASLHVPHVWHVREIPTAPQLLQKMLFNVVARKSARIISMSSAVTNLFPKSIDKTVQIPDGIDLAEFSPQISGTRIRNELNIDQGAKLVGFVGRLDPWKGADVFVKCAAAVAGAHPDAHFLVCGGSLDGYEAYARKVKQIAAHSGFADRIHFTDWQYRLTDIPEVMAALDVLVHTSVAPEPFGLVIVEAMASGKPVIAANAGGVLDIVVDGQTGALVTPGDVTGYTDALSRLLADLEPATTWGSAGRARAVELFDVKDYVGKVQTLYEGVLQSGQVKQ